MLAKYENPPLTADHQSEPIVIDDDEDEIQIESVESLEVSAKSVPRKGTRPRKRTATEILADMTFSDDDESNEMPDSVSRKRPRPVLFPRFRKPKKPKNPSTENSNKENSIGDFNKTLTRSR